jgi:hypothetical protein
VLFLDYLQMDLNINGNDVDIQPPSLSFIQTDSIYNFLNDLDITISDPNGYLQEYFLITEGTEITLTFGSKYGEKSIINKSPYVIKKIQQDKFAEYGTLAGELKCNSINRFYQRQERDNKGFYGKISEIIKNIINSYSLNNFSGLDIDPTDNNDFWYRTLQTDANFIESILLPNAYSSGSNNSPFYSFVTSDNVFHFRNLYTMLKASPVATFEYRVPISVNENDGTHLNLIQSLRRWQEGSNETKKFRHRNIYSVSRQDGSLIVTKDNITDHPSSESGKLSIINDQDLTTGFLNLGYDETDPGRKDNLKGQIINSARPSALMDRFIIITPFHPEVTAGKAIVVNFFIRDFQTNNFIASSTFSGKYIVEKSQHVFMGGKDLKGYSMFFIGRKFIPNIPGTYDLQKKLMASTG